MNSNIDPHVISTLQMEYNAHHQELRDLINSMDTNLKTGITMLTGCIAIAASFHETSILYIIPSIIFIATCIHLLKTASANIHGAYCQAIETRLKSLLGKDKVLLDWEGGKISQYISSPTSIVQIGFYIFFGVIFVIFIWFSILSYQWKSWTVFVHILEFVVILVYAILAILWNTPVRRAAIIKYYTVVDS
jgi:hypothetical protein